MITRYTVCVLVFLATAALPAGAVILRPDAPPPVAMPTQSQLDAARSREQAQGARFSDTAPAPQTTYPSKGQIDTSNTTNPRDLTHAFAVHEASDAAHKAGAEPLTDTSSTGRTRGIILMISAGACMLGLGLGRIVVNTLSHSTAAEAEKVVETVAEEDRSRSLGGEHREYIID